MFGDLVVRRQKSPLHQPASLQVGAGTRTSRITQPVITPNTGCGSQWEVGRDKVEKVLRDQFFFFFSFCACVCDGAYNRHRRKIKAKMRD